MHLCRLELSHGLEVHNIITTVMEEYHLDLQQALYWVISRRGNHCCTLSWPSCCFMMAWLLVMMHRRNIDDGVRRCSIKKLSKSTASLAGTGSATIFFLEKPP
jgi:hypothetical protein